jgi:hypothetical protein
MRGHARTSEPHGARRSARQPLRQRAGRRQPRGLPARLQLLRLLLLRA